MEPYTLTAHELLDQLNNKNLTCAQILSALDKRIREVDPRVCAYVRVDRAEANVAGRHSILDYHDSLLKGLPISIKDNICTQEYNTECCSQILESFVPPYDATVIKKLKSAGATILPYKTNMDEFAFGSSTENSYFGPTRNPWNLECVSGGSSGGSAACVAADEAIFSLGSDTGGSIRQPASFCGVVGMKPTYARVSRYGLIAFASSLDQIGPITKDVRDNALLLGIIAGHDPADSTSADIGVPDYLKAMEQDVKGLKVAVPKEYFVEGLDPEIKSIIGEAISKLKNLGAQCKEVSLPHTEYAVPVYYIIATAEASSNLARFDGVQYGFRSQSRESCLAGRQDRTENRLIRMYKKTRGEGFGQEAKRRIILGTFVLSHGYYDAYYLRALKVRTLIKNDFDAVFGDFDCILAPTSPTTAFRIKEKVEDPLKMYLCDIYTISANLAGIPAISVPCGFTKAGLPVGLQILAKPFDEEMLYRVAYNYEKNTEWQKKRPKI